MRRALGAAFVWVALVALAALPPGRAARAGETADCTAPAALSVIGARLDRSATLVAEGKGVAIVAIGSSSTLGVGASSPLLSYPSRLERDLRAAFPATTITVSNRGRGGQDVGEEFARLNRDVVDGRPDLVIWQVGTNALLRREDLGIERQLIGEGVELIRRHGIDVMLMDMQYAPRILARPGWGDMEQLIAEMARREQVGLFRRFDIMREWSRTGQLTAAQLTGPDGLHMTDVSYGCLAEGVARSLAEQWRAQGKLAQSSHLHPAALAGSEVSRREVAR